MRFSFVTVLALASAAFTSAAIVPRGKNVSRIDARHFDEAVVAARADIVENINDLAARASRGHARDFKGNKVLQRAPEVIEVREVKVAGRAHVRDFRRSEEEARSVEEREVPVEVAGRAHARAFRMTADDVVARDIEERESPHIEARAGSRNHVRDFRRSSDM